MKKLFRAATLAVFVFGFILSAYYGVRPSRMAEADPRSPVAMPVQSLDSNNNILGTSTNPVYTVAGSAPDGGVSPVEVVLGTTGGTPGLGLAGASACHVKSVKVGNPTASSAYFFLSNGTAIPDAGFTAMLDTPTLVPANSVVVLGDDHFGTSGFFLDAGCSVGVSATSASDGGHGAGTFTAVSKDFDISVYGYSP